MKVYVLQHEHDLDGIEDVKLIGIYATEADASAARARAGALPGFREAPDGFSIDEHELGHDGWATGFVRLDHSGETTDKAA